MLILTNISGNHLIWHLCQFVQHWYNPSACLSHWFEVHHGYGEGWYPLQLPSPILMILREPFSLVMWIPSLLLWNFLIKGCLSVLVDFIRQSFGLFMKLGKLFTVSMFTITLYRCIMIYLLPISSWLFRHPIVTEWDWFLKIRIRLRRHFYWRDLCFLKCVLPHYTILIPHSCYNISLPCHAALHNYKRKDMRMSPLSGTVLFSKPFLCSCTKFIERPVSSIT